MRIIAVSAGIISPVKESTNECIYLNYGLLGLVTGIKSQQPNWDVQMFQADTKAPMELINLIGYDRLMSSDYILLGCTSFLCLSWTERFTQLINMHKGKLIVGGRYVVDGNKDWLDGILTGVD